jgi:hypothetical protein
MVPIGMDHEKSGENQDFWSKTGKTGRFLKIRKKQESSTAARPAVNYFYFSEKENKMFK